jgi:predicted metal-dependent phosphoesterase TrpH
LNANIKPEKRWLKADLHTHCSLDPADYRVCSQSPKQLISHAAKLGYEVLAITCHNKDIWTESLSHYARNLGVVLIPGMEAAAERMHHTLVYNFHTGHENLNTLDKIRIRSRQETLVIAPHPFFPGPACLRGLLEKNPDVFDAIEYAGFHIRGLNFNRRSMDFCKKTGKPLVGCGDIHYLWQMDKTFTLIYAEPDILSIINAIKQGFVRIQTSPLSWLEAAGWWAATLWHYAFPVNEDPSIRFLVNGGREITNAAVEK